MDLPGLRNILVTYFSDSDLRDVCFDLGIDYENLGGDEKAGNARELVAYCRRHNRLAELENICRRLRPHAFQDSHTDPAKPGTTPPKTDFKFSVETLKDGRMLRGADLPLTIEGQYSSSETLHVWIVLQDSFGHYYLQSPEITFLPNNRWVAMNILPGMGIELVHFIRVGDRGHAQFRQMVTTRDFGAFDELPPDSTTLHSVRITRVR